MQKTISVVIPCHNESGNIENIHKSIKEVFRSLHYTCTLIFVDDGSTDNTSELVNLLSKKDKTVRLLHLSKNFGKELAVTAGLHHSKSDASLVIDADGQHPPEIIPEFIEKWEAGAKVVIGVRETNKNEGWIKKYGSIMFYKLFNRFSGVKLVPGSTDYRLIDSVVVEEFKKLNEQNRITRGLIDWLGFEREHIFFHASERTAGEASYSPSKLVRLALDSFVSLSFAPLYFFGYLGVLITTFSFVGGLFVLIEQYLLGDPLGLNFTGAASLGLLVLFVVGIILTSQGIMSLYISKIYSEAKRRPLFIVDSSKSVL